MTRKYFAYITVANQSWTQSQRDKFEVSLFNYMGAEPISGHTNVFVAELFMENKVTAQREVFSGVGCAMKAAGIIEGNFLASIENHRAYIAHLTCGEPINPSLN